MGPTADSSIVAMFPEDILGQLLCYDVVTHGIIMFDEHVVR